MSRAAARTSWPSPRSSPGGGASARPIFIRGLYWRVRVSNLVAAAQPAVVERDDVLPGFQVVGEPGQPFAEGARDDGPGAVVVPHLNDLTDGALRAGVQIEAVVI